MKAIAQLRKKTMSHKLRRKTNAFYMVIHPRSSTDEYQIATMEISYWGNFLTTYSNDLATIKNSYRKTFLGSYRRDTGCWYLVMHTCHNISL